MTIDKTWKKHLYMLHFFFISVCRSAVHFLESEFSQRNPQVKTVTSKGTELDTIQFRSEDPSGRKVTFHSIPYIMNILHLAESSDGI